MKAPEGAELGRCVFCREILYNSQASVQHAYAFFKKSKMVCGNCLIDLKDPVIEAFIANEQEKEDYKDDTEDSAFWWRTRPDVSKMAFLKISETILEV